MPQPSGGRGTGRPGDLRRTARFVHGVTGEFWEFSINARRLLRNPFQPPGPGVEDPAVMTPRFPLCALVCLCLAASLSACGGGSSGGEAVLGNAAPTVLVSEPSADIEVPETGGGILEVTFTNLDADDTSFTDLVLDADGDPATRSDQMIIATDLPEQGGAPQTVQWTADGLDTGVYTVLAIARDAGQFRVSAAPGRVHVNRRPSITVASPDARVVRSRGSWLEVRYADSDPDDVANSHIVADVDGDPSTVGAEDIMGPARLEQDGLPQQVMLDLDGADAGTEFSILGFTSDGKNSAASAAAPGTVAIENVAGAFRIVGGTQEYVGDMATFADGSYLVAGQFGLGLMRFGEGEPNETLISASTFIARYNADDTLAWVRSVGTGSAQANGLAVRSDGSFIMVGAHARDVTFGATTLTVSDVEVANAFVASYDSTGVAQWAVSIGGVGPDSAQDVVLLPDGSCVIGGYIQESGTFGAGEANETTFTGGRLEPIPFVAKYSVAGSLDWVRGGSGDVAAVEALDLRPDGTLLAVGYFHVASTLSAGHPDAITLTSAGHDDCFIANYGTDGALLWARTGGGLARDRAYDADSFPDGSFVVTGAFGMDIGLAEGDPATFGAGEPNEATLTSAGGTEVFIARFNADGTLAWARSARSEGRRFQQGEHVRVLEDGSIAVAGSMAPPIALESGLVTFGAGEANETTFESNGAFLARYAGNGDVRWARSIGPTPVSRGMSGLGVLPDGSLRITGTFEGPTITFGAGEDREVTLTGYLGSDDIYIARFNADGGF